MIIDINDALGLGKTSSGTQSSLVEYKFYNETESVFFDKDKHEYTRIVDDEFYVVPGVTTVTGSLDKEALVPWAAKMTCVWLKANMDITKLYTEEEFDKLLSEAKVHFRNYKEAAAETGTICHDWIEGYVKAKIGNYEYTNPFPEDPRAVSGCEAFLKWCNEHQVVFLASEQKIYSRQFNFAGTMDILALVDGVLCVVDIKTSNSLHRLEYGMQTAAYEAAVEEESGQIIKERWIIRLGKYDAEFEEMHLLEHHFDQDFATFLSVLDTHVNVEAHKALCSLEKKELKAAAKLQKQFEKVKAKEIAKAEKAEAKAKLKLLKVKASRRKKAA